MPRIADVLNVLLDVSTDKPTETTDLPLAEQFPQVNLVFEPAVPATVRSNGPTMARPTTSSSGQHPITVADVGKEPLGCDGAPPTGDSTYVAGCDVMPVERETRRGKTQTGGRRSCTLMVWFLFVAMLLRVDVVGAVFTPADSAALKAAVGTCNSGGCTGGGGCLGETADGSCPTFATSNVPGTSNPYGVIGGWDVSAVANMYQSKCSLSLSLPVATAPSVVVWC